MCVLIFLLRCSVLVLKGTSLAHDFMSLFSCVSDWQRSAGRDGLVIGWCHGMTSIVFKDKSSGKPPKSEIVKISSSCNALTDVIFSCKILQSELVALLRASTSQQNWSVQGCSALLNKNQPLFCDGQKINPSFPESIFKDLLQQNFNLQTTKNKTPKMVVDLYFFWKWLQPFL